MASDHHARTSPHAYPFPLTYTLYALSILLAATNTGLLGYFVADLRQDGMSVPYQFIIVRRQPLHLKTIRPPKLTQGYSSCQQPP